MRRAVTDGVRSMVEVLARVVPGTTSAAKRKKALAIYAGLVGALVLARAVDDPEMSEEILQAVSASMGVK